MRSLSFGLLLVASCAGQDPRENAVLFENAEERAKRDVSTIYYFENVYAVFSVVIPQTGPAEVCGEWLEATVENWRRMGFATSRRRYDHDRAVESDLRNAIEDYFAGLPAGTSERTLSLDPKPPPDNSDLKRGPGPYCIFGPETEIERRPAAPSRVRILHVSKGGEMKTLRVLMAPSKEFPAGLQPGGEPLQTIDEKIRRIAAPEIDLRSFRWNLR
jgi:hypothetical protein